MRIIFSMNYDFPHEKYHRGDWRSRGFIPHYDPGHCLQFITYRLADAMPEKIRCELWEKAFGDTRYGEKQQLSYYRMLCDQYFDQCFGSCILQQVKFAEIVLENWRHFEGERYRMIAYVIMPNHIHCLIEDFGIFSLEEILGSWKSYTSKEILKAGGLSYFPNHHVWQDEYWDRYIRNDRHYCSVINYIHRNPVKAKMVTETHLWPWTSAKPPEIGS